MIPASRVYLWMLPLIATGCVLLAALDLKPADPYSAFGHFAIGCSIGTLSGQTTIAALWSALGPAGLYRRVLFSMIWLTLLLSAVAIGLRLRPESLALLSALGTTLVLQWVLIQVPLWLLAFAYGLRLGVGGQSDGGQPQFGLRQLMVFILCIAVILGLSRFSVTWEFLRFALLGTLLLAAPAILIGLPLTLAALLPRRAWLAVPLVVVLIGLATPAESWLLARIFGAGGPELIYMVWLNLFTSAWILAFVVVGRLNGYRLTRNQ